MLFYYYLISSEEQEEDIPNVVRSQFLVGAVGSFILKWFEYLKQLLITFAWHANSVELI